MLPRFFSRIADATVPLFDGLARDELQARLAEVRVALVASEQVSNQLPLRRGYLLAANLFARIYPTLTLDAPASLRDEAAELARTINPKIEILHQTHYDAPRLRFDGGQPQAANEVTTWASGWNVGIDGALADAQELAVIPAALAAGAIGVGEVFRIVFAELLAPPRPREGMQPGSLNLITLEERTEGLPLDLKGLDLGRVHLVGCGAIGEAFVEAIRGMGVEGTLVAVDPERVEESNLQRYVLAGDTDERALKTEIVKRALDDDTITVEEVKARWGEADDARLSVDVAAVGLDTPEDRVGVAASLPRRVYNAFTQPLDLGWSRHEEFGTRPCLACLYWPTHETLGRHEVIGKALEEAPRRVLAYLAMPWAVGRPLVRHQLGEPDPPSAEEAEAWMSRALIDDVLERFNRPASERSRWAERDIEDLYRDGICGGAILGNAPNDPARAVLVPLAHQSVLAGVMLAVQVLAAANPALAAARPELIEGRFDVLRGFPQAPPVPTARPEGCLCFDADFVVAANPQPAAPAT
ncbi:MAG: hypothetical protein QOH16_3876 [Gaiellaceae bacterium]|nr:hypothetical protein [Gaiellaceae bacterium]